MTTNAKETQTHGPAVDRSTTPAGKELFLPLKWRIHLKMAIVDLQ